MMNTKEKTRFFKFPAGTNGKQIPFASIAETATSVEIVTDAEPDAFYFRGLEKSGIQLNRSQIEAVRSVDGSLLILAGAGTGKTSVLVCRTGYLLDVQKVSPQQLLLMTFTKKAADEMKERIASLPGIDAREARKVEVRTFHSFFLQILRHSGFRQEMLVNDKFKQIILKKKMRELSFPDELQPESVLSLLSLYKMNGKSVEDMPNELAADQQIKQLASHYEDWKKKNNKMDFDDVLTEAFALLKSDVGLLQTLQQRFQYIMVDEFQDTNPLQYELIKRIAALKNNLCVVGDDDQTIYAFQGARNDIILDFDQQYPDVKTVILTINYRSTSPIVGLGNAVINQNKIRMEKQLQSTRTSSVVPKYLRPGSTDEEAEWIAEEMMKKVNEGSCEYRDIAILHRTASNSRAIFEQLALEEIPFFDHGMGGNFFYEQSTISPVIAYMKLAINPLDWHAFEIILPTMYIQKDTGMQQVHAEQMRHPRQSLIEHMAVLPTLKPYQRKTIEEKRNLIRQLPSLEPKVAVRKIRKQFYDKYLETNDQKTVTTQKESIKEQLDELETSAGRFEKVEDMLTFIKDMKKRHEQMKMVAKNPGANVVQMMTIHKAKGLEFPVVFFIGASEGIVPHITAIDMKKYEDVKLKATAEAEQLKLLEEERRLAYVAITRAKEELYISSPAFYRGNKIEVSRFIQHVFGVEEKKSIKNRAGKVKEASEKRKVYAWICTSDTCIAWQRITSNDEAIQVNKSCPLCSSPMEKGEKYA
ncbi:UvrD-helicase domain-containing protein [Lederbergia lenta]|uniref:DNA 3'-5' helicase n=1 Tax=Lederbergia lenta TaxID=1467 RepID=A0A2X4YZF4_LEDLE|nr:UvrD-helicase domain-containing protein [Lederbergia lenta]MEC2325777.1 UvrD-helicase domain-containing protein [Lederbergia lenta]SQI53764.1 ATP-dependent DNA helicase, UvrD/REP family [Lederbergia lenta]